MSGSRFKKGADHATMVLILKSTLRITGLQRKRKKGQNATRMRDKARFCCTSSGAGRGMGRRRMTQMTYYVRVVQKAFIFVFCKYISMSDPSLYLQTVLSKSEWTNAFFHLFIITSNIIRWTFETYITTLSSQSPWSLLTLPVTGSRFKVENEGLDMSDKSFLKHPCCQVAISPT